MVFKLSAKSIGNKSPLSQYVQPGIILGEWGTYFYEIVCSNYYLDLSDLPELKKVFGPPRPPRPTRPPRPSRPLWPPESILKNKFYEFSPLRHANRAQLGAGLSWRGGCNFVIRFSRKKREKKKKAILWLWGLQDPFLCFLSILSCSWVSRAAGERLTLHG